MFQEMIRQIQRAETISYTGKIENIVGMSIEASGGRAAVGDICQIYNGDAGGQVMAEVVGFKNDHILLMPYSDMSGISAGNFVRNTGRRLSLRMGPFLKGRVINALGQPIDGKGPFQGGTLFCVENNHYINPMTRPPIRERMEFGVKAIDSMLTIGKGQRIGIFAGSGVGKSTLMGMIAKNVKADINVIALVGERGAGCVFFSGCNLRCCFCQNKPISQGEVGKVLTAERLREIFHELIGQEAACLDLVTPTHFTDAVLEALGDEEWPVPVVWNCGGYEKPETLRRLEGKVQVYLPDLKYGLSEPARKYSGAADYFDWAKRAILEMFRQTGPYRMENGLLKQGVLIRHLLLPGELENTRRVIDWVAESFRPGEVLFSLMSQYTPQPGAEGKLARHVTKAEYRAAVEYMENCGITDGYTQERTSAREEYTPAFDLRGI